VRIRQSCQVVSSFVLVATCAWDTEIIALTFCCGASLLCPRLHRSANGVTASDHDNPSKCINCVPGKYASIQGTWECSSCSAGKTSTSPFAVCTDCQAGEYSSSTGSENCDRCPPGKYSESTGASSCLTCPSGSYTTEFGTATCPLCPKGKFSDNTGKEFLTGCETCFAGTYAPLATGSSECLDCEPGKYAQGDGASESCDKCEAGEYQDLSGQIYCKNCAGGLSSVAGSTFCVDCPGIVISGECVRCEAGYYAMAGGCAR
jgi:hypothetical protein